MPEREIKYPKIGFDSAQAHLFDILEPAYRQWTQRQTRANALAVAQAAWQMVDR